MIVIFFLIILIKFLIPKECIESFCSVCNSLTSCSACIDTYFLKTPLNISCSLCNGVGEIPDTINKICKTCVDNCAECNSTTTCKTCLDGYFLASSKQCLAQKSLYAELKINVDPKQYNLVFSDAWLILFTKLSENLSLNISGHSKDEYQYSISQDKDSLQQINIQFNFSKDIKIGDILDVEIDYADSLSEEFLLNSRQFSVAMNFYCISPTTYLICNFFLNKINIL